MLSRTDIKRRFIAAFLTIPLLVVPAGLILTFKLVPWPVVAPVVYFGSMFVMWHFAIRKETP